MLLTNSLSRAAQDKINSSFRRACRRAGIELCKCIRSLRPVPCRNFRGSCMPSSVPTSRPWRNHGGPPPVVSRRYRVVTGCLSIRLNYSEILVIATPRHNAKLIRTNVKPHPKNRSSLIQSDLIPRVILVTGCIRNQQRPFHLSSDQLVSSFNNNINLTEISISKCVH